MLLDDQDRSRWDPKLIAVAEDWLVRSATDNPSRFHLEAVIAQHHCVAKSVEQTNWDQIIQFYNLLIQMRPSPIYRLNRAIAIAQTG